MEGAAGGLVLRFRGVSPASGPLQGPGALRASLHWDRPAATGYRLGPTDLQNAGGVGVCA